MKASPIQTSFNGGELSELVAGRVDVAKYRNACKRMENFLPTIQGPALARPGFRFVAEVKNSANRCWLVRFEFSDDDSYILEFGDQYIRFFTNRGQLLNAGVPYEIASPYTAASLTNADGTFALRYAQTGDVIYLVHPSYEPRKLSRSAPTSWTLAVVDLIPPPFKDENDTATTVYSSAETGTVTLTASASLFTTAHVGQYIKLTEKSVRDTKLWESGKSITTGDVRRSNSKNYRALNSATTGGTKPIHSDGAVFDGDNGVQWEYLDDGFGYAKITAYTSATQVTATVVSHIPVGATGSGNATKRWAFQAWNATDGYPSCVTFFRERLVFARNETLWFSVTADFENFATEIDGEVSADAAFDRTISGDRVNSIRWISPGNVLLVGTNGDEWVIAEQSSNDAFGPTNVQTRRPSTYASNRAEPARVSDVLIFVQKAGRKVRAMAYQFSEDTFKADDVTAFAEHIAAPYIVDIAYQQEPWSVLWCARSDGALVGMTYYREHDVLAWHRHPMTGAVVECVETIPSPGGGKDDLWIIARYTVNGVTRRYVAYLGDYAEETTAQADWAYSDMHAVYSGSPATTISGLGYLEGKTVWVLADGAVHPERTVSGGAITLQRAASKVVVGLPCVGILETMGLEAGSQTGTGQGKIKRVNGCAVRVLRTMGAKAGPTVDKAQELVYRTPSVPMGSAPPAYTGDVYVEWDADYDTQQTLVVVKDKPTPVNVVAVMPEIVTESR